MNDEKREGGSASEHYECLMDRERQVLERRNAGEDAASIAAAFSVSIERLGWIETQARRKVEGLLRRRVEKATSGQDDNLNPAEAKLPLRFNGIAPAEFIKRAFGLGADLNGVGRYDRADPVQQELRRIRDWITMAEHDSLNARKGYR